MYKSIIIKSFIMLIILIIYLILNACEMPPSQTQGQTTDTITFSGLHESYNPQETINMFLHNKTDEFLLVYLTLEQQSVNDWLKVFPDKEGKAKTKKTWSRIGPKKVNQVAYALDLPLSHRIGVFRLRADVYKEKVTKKTKKDYLGHLFSKEFQISDQIQVINFIGLKEVYSLSEQPIIEFQVHNNTNEALWLSCSLQKKFPDGWFEVFFSIENEMNTKSSRLYRVEPTQSYSFSWDHRKLKEDNKPSFYTGVFRFKVNAIKEKAPNVIEEISERKYFSMEFKVIGTTSK